MNCRVAWMLTSAGFNFRWSPNQPEWPLLGFEHLDQLPGIRWKLHNLGRLRKANAR